MNKLHIISPKKSLKSIELAGEKLLLQGDVKLLTINNLVKKSGYSVGNIYYHYKNIQNFYTTIFLRKRLGVYIELINEINNFPSAKSGPDLWKFILEFILIRSQGNLKLAS